MINIFNEECYALQILNQGFLTNKQGLELFILAKYYRFKKELSKNECKDKLKEFCKTQIENSEQSDIYKKINSAINQAYDKEAQFLVIDHIVFTNIELNYIKELDISPIAKQVLFCLWCCNKLNIKANQSDKWVNISYQELKKFCNISNGNMIKIMNELYNHNLIFISDRCAICLTFLDEFNKITLDEWKKLISPNVTDNSFYIDDFKTCGLWWQKYIGNKKIITCRDCGVLTVRGSNRQKYCKECAKQRELNGKNLYNKAYYSSHK